jgi:hypothetical protein
VPQILHSTGILHYSEHVKKLLESKSLLPYGSPEESMPRHYIFISSDFLSRHTLREHPGSRRDQKRSVGHARSRIAFFGHAKYAIGSFDASTNKTADAVTLDFALWNLAKEQEFTADLLPHHRTRSVFY